MQSCRYTEHLNMIAHLAKCLQVFDTPIMQYLCLLDADIPP